MARAISTKDAESKLYNLLGEDKLFDMLGMIPDEKDVRPLIQQTLKLHLEILHTFLRYGIQKLLRFVKKLLKLTTVIKDKFKSRN
jgi:hypothetical protein